MGLIGSGRRRALQLTADKMPAMSILSLQSINTDVGFKAVNVHDDEKTGTFYLDNETTLSVDNILVVQDSNGNKWVRKGYDYLKAEWFGAKGDGVTNDTAALQAFIDKAGSMGDGVIKLTPGKSYLVTEVNMSTPFSTFQGDRAYLKGVLSIGGSLATEYNITVQGVNFDSDTACIKLNKCRRVKISNNEFRNAEKAIHCPATTGFHAIAQLDISGNRFVDVDYCWLSETSSWDVLSDCYFSHNICNSPSVTAVQLTGIDGLTSIGNTFFFSTTVGSRENKEHHFKITEQSDWVVFTGNKFFEAGYESLYLEKCRHLDVFGNHFARSGQRATKSTIYLTGDPTSAALEKPTWNIIGNQISLFSKDFIDVDSNTYGNLNVVGNTINYNNFFSQYFGPDTLSALTHYTVNTGAGKNTKINVIEEANSVPVETNHLRRSGNISIQNRAVSDLNAMGDVQGWFVTTASPSNGPVAGFGQGFRIYVDNNQFSYKDYAFFGTDWYSRSGTTSSPGSWYKMLNMQNVKASLQDSFLTTQVTIDNSASLDTYTTQGIYVRGSDSGNTAALGYPYDGIQKGIMLILKWDANNISQEYKVANGDVFVRYYNTTAWTSWRQTNNTNRTPISATKTVNYNPNSNDRNLPFDCTSGNLTSVLPSAASTYVNGHGQVYWFKKTDASANTLTVDGNLAETIDGSATLVLAAQGNIVEIQSTGTEWIVKYKNF